MKIVWIKDARNDLENIYRFVVQYNINAAAKVHNDILDWVDRLGDFPQLGTVDPLLSSDSFVYRSLVVRRAYKVIYRADSEYVYIIAVWDCRQNPYRLLRSISKRNK